MNHSMSTSKSENIILPPEVLDKLLAPIPKKILVEKVGEQLGENESKPFEAKQSKREYVTQHLGQKFSLEFLREMRALHEHYNIKNFNWLLFRWDKDITNYFPELMKEQFEKVIKKLDSLITVDFLVVDKKNKTVFLLLENWKNEIIADAIIKRVEAKIPKYFRAYFSLSKKMLLIQERSKQATKDFLALFKQAYAVKLQEIRINAMVIREFVKRNPKKLTKLTVKVPQEVAGFNGLSELTIVGSDVIKGSKGLMDRHETSPILIGPWVGVANKKIELKVGESLKTSGISHVLKLFDLITELS